MKKTLLSCAALLVTFAIVGCQPTDTATPDTSTDVAPAAPADSNVTATAETPAVVEAPAADAPAAEATAAPAEEAAAVVEETVEPAPAE